ncbi:glycohydrolase toxin TNT-related protein [Actinokineospora globicatena]|uniref:TNT domain-containing protein n=1 Tax=Actinokineospora globicatena TaxID=103729 RepID=A0A9W6QJ89_9PSEU|nr:glycohydrolase toxin TNT-related protein [Actinokineospora globicatena]GLW89609.1 hypothetical protein Aglo03_04250 [Actinokineospora globicatena]
MSRYIGVDGDVAGVVGDEGWDEFESVFTLRTLRDGVEVPEAHPLSGYLADEPVRQVREAPRDERVAVWFPSLPTDVAPESAPESEVLEALGKALTDAAPEGWAGLRVECEAVGSWMAVTASVTVQDGSVQYWSPPAMVGQWLHRLRVHDFHPGRGTWFRATFDLAPDTPLTHVLDFTTAPSELSDEDAADELRLLPRNPNAIPDWLIAAALRSSQAARAGYAETPDAGPAEFVRVFDGVGSDGRPTWYRPVLGAREREAIVEYLSDAPIVLSARGRTPDELGTDESAVPMAFHTDGRFVWPTAVAYYLHKHGVPPVQRLVEHIRAVRHLLPDRIPAIALDRASALAMGRPWDESEAETAAHAAMGAVESVIIERQISPRYYSVLEDREHAWSLFRDGDRYQVRSGPKDSVLFDDVRQAAAYLAGQLLTNAGQLKLQDGEPIPPWQSPLRVLGDDPPVESFASIAKVRVGPIEVDRYGEPDGNLVFVADTPFELRGLPPEHAERPYHRYRLSDESWGLLAVTTAAGGVGYVLPQTVEYYLGSGHFTEIPMAGHPGLPPVTDGMRAEAARNPGGWLYCADPDADPRFIEGMPLPVLLGGYKVGPDGVLTGETYINEDYRPSPRRRGYPEPHTHFEQVLGYVAAGWLPHERILAAVLESPFILESDGQGGLRVGVDANGQFLAVYSSPRFVPPTAQNVQQANGRDLARALTGITLIINPGGDFGITLPGDDLARVANQPPAGPPAQ